MNDAKILVPIRLEALIVNNETSDAENWKNFSLDYEMMARRMGTELETEDLQTLQSGLCEPGIHLHWALPAALTNGIYIKEKNQVIFPAVPNRWLIIRTQISKGKPVTKKWIVESDYIDSGAKSPWAVQKADGSFSDTFIGRAVELEQWEDESKPANTPLTAVAPGNAAFAAVYQCCREVFGFYDNLEGIEEGTFSYLVTGWYSEPGIDPLNNSDTRIKDNLKNKWALPALKTGDSFPDGIFCHGFIHSVIWKGDDGDYTLPYTRGNVNVGVGYTSIEAKAAQVSRQTGAAEKLLSAFFYDALKDVESAATIETQVDDRAFSHVDGGALWEIQRTEGDTEKEQEELGKPHFPDKAAFPQLHLLFKKLNRQQHILDNFLFKKESLHVAFRAVCDKIIKAEFDEMPEAVKKQLEVEREALKKEIDILADCIVKTKARVDEHRDAINNHKLFNKGDGTLKPEFELIERKMPRFWKPNDPVVVFSGSGVKSSVKYKIPGDAEKLPCRLISEVIAQLLLKDEGIEEKSFTAPSMSPGIQPLGSLHAAHIDIINKLFNEALLLDPVWAAEWAHSYYGDTAKKNQNAIAFAKQLKKILDTDDATPAAGYIDMKSHAGTVFKELIKTKPALKLLLEKWAIQKWKHPWTPVYMIWSAKWMPAYTTGDGRVAYAKDRWTWKDKRYAYTGPAPDEKGVTVFSGKAIVTDALTGILRAKLPDVATDYNISQAFSAFSDALLMRRHAIRLPLLQKKTQANRKLVKDTRYDNYLTNAEYFFPGTDFVNDNGINEFFPLRAGHSRITRLWLTDAFGQVQKVIADSKPVTAGVTFVAANLKDNKDKELITLTPRIIQPSRLSFRWTEATPAPIAEGDDNPVLPGCAHDPLSPDSTSDPGTSPVCGWLMPDSLNRSLNIYDAAGESCGSVKITDDSKGRMQLDWIGPLRETESSPGSKIQNRYLLEFVNGLLEHGKPGEKSNGVALSLLFNLCRSTALFLDTPAARQSPGIAGLVGQPVALVRASLKFDLQGLPVQPQGWKDSLTSETKIDPPGMQGLEFPVSLGDTRNSKDGLIGYFTDKDGFGKMHIAYGSNPDDGKNAYFVRGDVSLSFKTNADPAGITLLMDPRGGVQADCGLLPSKFIDLPPHFTDKALKNIQMHLLVAPFLGAPGNAYVPVSTEQDRNWILFQQQAPGVWKEMDATKPVPLQSNAFNTQRIQEGYLVLKPVPPAKK